MKKIRFVLCFCLPLSIVAVLSSCQQEENCTPHPVTGGCISTQEYNPVCGCDNKTYSNASEARCQGIDVFTLGKCSK